MGIPTESRKLLAVCAASVAAGYIAWLAIQFVSGHWIKDTAGHPLVTDFLAPYAAGDLARTGHAIFAYNGGQQYAAESTIVGHAFSGRLGWPYPPQYFFALAPLAYLSYAQAFLFWIIVTIGGYAAVVGAIARRREAMLFAIAAPWCLADLLVGQNGFLTAALTGLFLLTLERRPMVSAALICLLAYKPQFGVLLPIALAAGGYWRVIGVAALVMLVLALITGVVFGFDTFGAFLGALPSTSHTLIEQGGVGWGKLQSVYGLLRWAGSSNSAAWTAHGLFALTVAAAVAWLWRSKATLNLKAAGLSAAIVLATPYVFLYDLPVLAIPIAFLSRERTLDLTEIGAVVVAGTSFILATLLAAPLAWIGPLAIAAVCGRRFYGDVLNDTPAVIMRGAS